MKKILISSILFFSLNAHAQSDATNGRIDTSKIKFVEPPDSTGFGTPDGKLVSKEIGQAGGTIVSDDGRVELVFPTDALTANTNISIQPTTNPVIQGVGKAYQFEPSGTQFKKPVQFIFHYTKEETETCPAGLMNFALQDKKGKWTFLQYDNWDSTTRTLKGSIQHFSGVTTTKGVMLIPKNGVVLADGAEAIDIYDQFKKIESGPHAGAADRPTTGNYFSSVNGVDGGNDVEGTIPYQGERHGQSIAKMPGFMIYLAPKIMPVQNPVVISLFFQYYSEIVKQWLWGIASCRIQVNDEYKVEVSSVYTGRAGMHAKLNDKASFVVTIYPNSEFHEQEFIFKDVKNYPPTVIKEGKKTGFKEKVITTDAQGHINITSHTNDKLSNDYPPKVSFDLDSQEFLLCEVQYSKRGIKGPVQPVHYQSIPAKIDFIANGEPQHQSVFLANRDIGYELIVTPHREEGQK